MKAAMRMRWTSPVVLSQSLPVAPCVLRGRRWSGHEHRDAARAHTQGAAPVRGAHDVGQPIEDVLTATPRLNDAGVAEGREVLANVRLAQSQDGRQVGDRSLAPHEKQEDAHPRVIPQQAEQRRGFKGAFD